MKAEILKLAGVNNDADFYKKFPTEKAFMAKYGKRLEKLKKAKVGDMIAGDIAPTKQAAPISYTDLQNQTQEQFTGISTAERNRREALDSQQAIANSNSGGGGLGDLLTQYGPQLAEFASSAFGAKNGKKLKRAQDGFMGAPFKGMPSKSVSSNSGFNTDVSQNPYMSGSLIGGQKAQQSSGSWAANPYIDSPFKASQSSGSSKSGFDLKGTLKDMAPLLAMQAGPIIGAFEEIEANKKKLAEKKKFGKVSDVVLQAQNTIAEPSQRRYIRPEDKLVNSMNPLGAGTNYLAARNGAEIQNTYAPNDIYTDSGYEPLNDSLPKAQGGFSMASFDPLSGLGGSLGGKLGSATGKGSGQAGPYSKLAATAGGLALSWLPGGSFIGSTLGGYLGGLADSTDQNEMQAADDHTTNNTLASTFGSGAKAIQGQNKGFMEDGGWVSHDWQPQVITSFGEHSMKDLLKPDPMMDTLRAGGHLSYYTPPSERAMSTERAEYGTSMAMGGDLRTVWGGKAEPISYNPYLPNGGETVMFRGQSHDETNGNGQSGIGVQYGDGGMRGYAENGISSQQADVEVERNEPATVMKDGDGKDNLVVFGNMEIPGYGANEIGDPKAKGMKFKRYIADLSKQEAKNNKYMDKSLDLINSADTNDPFQQLSFNSGKAMMLGSQMNLKSIADKKKNAAAVQDAILETAEQYGMDSAKLAKQKIANFGGKFTSSPMAQNGISMEELIPESRSSSYIPNLSKQIMDAKSAAKISEQARHANDFNIANYIPSKLFYQGVPLKDTIGTFNPGTDNSGYRGIPYSLSELSPNIGGYVNPKSALEEVKVRPEKSDAPAGNPMLQGNIFDTQKQMKAKSGFPFESILQMGLTSAAPFLRNRYDDSVSPEQLAPEMLAAALNQIEPVGAQLYNPMLTQATSISLQDQLNEVTAQTRAAERLAQGDPSALAMIASQGQQAKSKILGEQFRMNQAEKQRVSEQNAAVLNDAQMKNLALLDQQMVRQFEGRSKTKTQAIEIAKNIADKIAKKKSENLAANVYQNMYPDYNFTSSGTAYKNPFSIASFGPGMGRGSTQGVAGGMQVGNKMLLPTNYDKRGNPTNYKLIGSDDDTNKLVKNGAIVKAFKNF